MRALPGFLLRIQHRLSPLTVTWKHGHPLPEVGGAPACRDLPDRHHAPFPSGLSAGPKPIASVAFLLHGIRPWPPRPSLR
ncbi:hypothetical protein MGWOODY_Smn2876 [hydrothermal vent metagenome]|uniref:Uncharacterized protein n=1 Tax=hydrothermal vent metagenome TaxID=652676 RepID=A0A160TP46_9ZZZZ